MKFILIFLLSFSATANTFLSFGGWSHHFGDMPEGEYNEQHNGFGIEHYFGEKHQLGVGAFYMTDSYGKEAYHVGASFRRNFGNLSIDAKLMYLNRSGLQVQKWSRNGQEYLEVKAVRIDFVGIVPFINYTFNNNLGVSFTLLPSFTESSDSVLFMNFTYRI